MALVSTRGTREKKMIIDINLMRDFSGDTQHVATT